MGIIAMVTMTTKGNILRAVENGEFWLGFCTKKCTKLSGGRGAGQYLAFACISFEGLCFKMQWLIGEFIKGFGFVSYIS